MTTRTRGVRSPHNHPFFSNFLDEQFCKWDAEGAGDFYEVPQRGVSGADLHAGQVGAFHLCFVRELLLGPALGVSKVSNAPANDLRFWRRWWRWGRFPTHAQHRGRNGPIWAITNKLQRSRSPAFTRIAPGQERQQVENAPAAFGRGQPRPRFALHAGHKPEHSCGRRPLV